MNNAASHSSNAVHCVVDHATMGSGLLYIYLFYIYFLSGSIYVLICLLIHSFPYSIYFRIKIIFKLFTYNVR